MKHFLIILCFIFFVSCSVSYSLDLHNATTEPIQISITSDEFNYIQGAFRDSLSENSIARDIVTTPYFFYSESCSNDDTANGRKKNFRDQPIIANQICYDSFDSVGYSSRLLFTLQAEERITLYAIPDISDLDLSSIDTIHIRFRNGSEIQLHGSKAIRQLMTDNGKCTNCEIRIGDH